MGKGRFELHFGALCDPINEQLIRQGYMLESADNDRFQKILCAIILLKLHGMIPSSVVLSAEKKLIRQISKVVIKVS